MTKPSTTDDVIDFCIQYADELNAIRKGTLTITIQDGRAIDFLVARGFRVGYELTRLDTSITHTLALDGGKTVVYNTA